MFMKKMILAGLMLGATANASASELKFGDLNYFLKAYDYTLGFQAEMGTNQQTTQNTKIETEGWYVDGLVNFGLMDDLTLFAGVNYQYDLESSNETTNAARFNSDGMGNPIVGGVYRLMRQNDFGANFDLGALARVNVQDEEVGSSSGSNSVDGNAAVGRSSVDVFARLGNKWDEANEWQTVIGGVYHQSGERTDLGLNGASDVTTDLDSSMDYYLKATYQYRPVNEFMMALGAQATYVGAKEEDTSGVVTDYDSHLDLNFSFKAKYLVTSDVVANVSLSVSELPDYDADQGGKIEITERSASRMGFGVDWLF